MSGVKREADALGSNDATKESPKRQRQGRLKEEESPEEAKVKMEEECAIIEVGEDTTPDHMDAMSVLETKTKTLKSEKASLTRQVKRLQTSIQEKDGGLAHLQGRVRTLEQDLENSHVQAAQQHRAARKQIQSLEKESSQSDEKTNQLRSLMLSLERQKVKVECDLQSQHTSFGAELLARDAKARQVEHELRNRIHELEGMKVRKERTIMRVQDCMMSLERQKVKAECDLQSQRKSFDAELSAKDAKARQVERELQGWIQELEGKVRKEAKATTQVQDCMSSLEHLKKKAESDLQSQRKSFDAELSAKGAKARQVERELQGRIHQLEGKVRKEAQATQAYTTQVRGFMLSLERQKLKAESDLRSQRKSFDAELSAKDAKARQVEWELRGKIQELEANKVREEADATVARVQDELETLKSENKDLTQQVKRLQRAEVALRAQAQAAVAMQEGLRGRIQELEGKEVACRQEKSGAQKTPPVGHVVATPPVKQDSATADSSKRAKPSSIHHTAPIIPGMTLTEAGFCPPHTYRALSTGLRSTSSSLACKQSRTGSHRSRIVIGDPSKSDSDSD